LNALRKSYEARNQQIKMMKIDEVLEKLANVNGNSQAKKEMKVEPGKAEHEDFGAPPPPGEKVKEKKVEKAKGLSKEELISALKSCNLAFSGKLKVKFNKAGSIIRVDLGNQGITDISPLAKLPELNSLELWGNSISDITPLKKMHKLQWLGLNDNLITDISPLKDLPLQGVSLANLPIKDLTPLNDKITHLSLVNCSLITDMTPVSKMKKLEHLLLPPHFRRLHINFIKELSKLKTLDTKNWRKDGVWSKEKFLEKNQGYIE
jgi:hypothetical protein